VRLTHSNKELLTYLLIQKTVST